MPPESEVICDQNLVETNEHGVVVKVCDYLIFFACSRYNQVGLEAASPSFDFPITIPDKIAICTKANTHYPQNPLTIVCQPYARKANYQVKEKNPTVSK